MQTLKEFLQTIKEFLSYSLYESKDHEIDITIRSVVILIIVFFITWLLLRIIRKIVNRKLEENDRPKFDVVFSFSKYIIFTIVFMVTLDSVGVKVTGFILGSTALFVGLGLGLQQLFQDIIAGIYILVDRSIKVGDVIEIDEKIGTVFEIKLRTTRAKTIDNKVLIIPNHKFLDESLYNWTQNGRTTREVIEVGVAYESDVELVKKLLLKAASENPKVLKKPEPIVLFSSFGDSALLFKLVFTVNNSFEAVLRKSDLYFQINKSFKENNITIPFPQRDVHLYQKPQQNV